MTIIKYVSVLISNLGKACVNTSDMVRHDHLEDTHLSRVKQIQRIDGLLDGLHEVDSPKAQLFDQILALSLANTVLSGT